MDTVLASETRERQLHELRAADAAMMPFGHTLGFRVESVTAGEAVVLLECGSHLHNVFGYTHGGAIFSAADTAMGLAYVASLGPHQTGTTVEAKINFLRPSLSGELRAHARCIKQGKSLSFYECDVLDEQKRLVARTSATMMTLDDHRSDGRRHLYEAATQPEADITEESRNR
jgi:acyl-CoA thioesterase